MDLGDMELTLTPISGKSGKAYMGSYPNGKRIFVKMNTSPILSGLAREQIAPQLLWSRRLSDGRDMCAQEWLTGKILTPSDMNRKQIIDILTRLHRSRPLMTQLTRFDYFYNRSWLTTLPIDALGYNDKAYAQHQACDQLDEPNPNRLDKLSHYLFRSNYYDAHPRGQLSHNLL